MTRRRLRTRPSGTARSNELMRAAAPQILIDNSQGFADIPTEGSGFLGSAHHYKSAPIEAEPDIMAFNPGPMTFRGGAAYTGGGSGPSKVTLASFDSAQRTAQRLREKGIKPQVFLYHPGHLDILDYLIEQDVLEKPYFLQLGFRAGERDQHQHGQFSLHGAESAAGLGFPDLRAWTGGAARERDVDAARRARAHGAGGLYPLPTRRVGGRAMRRWWRASPALPTSWAGGATVEETRRILALQ